MFSSLFIVSLVFLFVFNNEGVMGVKIPKFTMKTPSFDPKGKFASVHHARAATAKMQSITTTSADVQTLLVYEYTSNKQCDGDANLIATIPFNLCMTGFSEDGKILGSGIYQFNSTQALPVFTTTYYREYTNADCTGEITYEVVNNYPSYCLALEDAGTVQSARFEFSSESDPSSMIKIPGISMEYFDTNEHCNTASTNPPASTTWVALNTCLVSDEQTSFRFNGCGNHKISVEVFSDANCQISTVKADSPLQETCIVYDDRSPSTDSGFYYNTYTFSKCT